MIKEIVMINRCEKFTIKTGHNDVISLTETVKDFIKSTGIKKGQCIIFTPHTTAALTITSFWDPRGFEDIMDEIDRLIPTRINFKHQHDTPQDAAGHVKSTLIGVSLAIPINEGKLILGHSQGIYFLEFDGPRNREYSISVLGE